MPQSKKYTSQAARQKAYRERCKRAREIEQTSKGLPSLPAIAAMPGWSRWNACFQAASELLTSALNEMQAYYDDRTERWQEDERGEEFQERTGAVEAAIEILSDLVKI